MCSRQPEPCGQPRPRDGVLVRAVRQRATDAYRHHNAAQRDLSRTEQGGGVLANPVHHVGSSAAALVGVQQAMTVRDDC